MTLPRTGLGTTSLGAVGGARGTAAGGIRILVEFLTQYDSKAVKQLEADLAGLQAQETAAAARAVKAVNDLRAAEDKLLATRTSLKRVVALRGADPASGRTPQQISREITQIRNIGVLTKEGDKRLRQLDKEVGAHGVITRFVRQEALLQKQITAGKQAAAAAAAAETAATQSREETEGRLGRLKGLAAGLPSKLGGLALGAVGGIFGGALIGVGFAAAEAALDVIEQGILDLVDPARHARDAILEIGEAIEGMTGDGVSRIEATEQFLKDLGITADEATVGILAQAAAQAKATKSVEEWMKILEILKHPEAAHEQNVKNVTDALIKQAGEEGNLVTVQVAARGGMIAVADAAFYEAEALKIVAQFGQQAAAAIDQTDAANRRAAASAQLAAFAYDRFAQAVAGLVARQSSIIDRKIESVQTTGPSKRTQALEAALERAQGGGQNASRQKELANIAEERALILLRQRLRLLGTNIDLEKFSGKFLLEAIEAKQKALEKEARAQDRLNKLLDLQFRMAQKIRRNEGESIQDFLERRAQENRHFLQEQRDLEREKTEERLQELEDKTKDEVALQELSEREKTAAATDGTSDRIKQLQKELEASRKKDAEALKSQIEALEDQKKAFADKANEVVRMASEEEQEKIRLAISGVKVIGDLIKVSSQVNGTRAALAFIRAFGGGLVASGLISAGELATIINRLETTLVRFAAAQRKVLGFAVSGGKKQTGPITYAGGGIISLNNARNPFGGDRQFGEQGSETALILSNKLTQKLQEGRGTGEMNFYLQRGDDWLRDRYEMKRLVKEAVSEVLR